MMKTYRHLSTTLFSLANLERAYRQARKGKTGNPRVRDFDEHWRLNLVLLWKELRTRAYRPEPLNRFVLRDHMDDLELIFTMLGEASTTSNARDKEARGFPENKDAAQEGDGVAGIARKELEKRSGRPVSTKENYLPEPERRKRLAR